jgi:hypothetical protein
MLRLYIWGYLNQVRSSRHLERACPRPRSALANAPARSRLTEKEIAYYLERLDIMDEAAAQGFDDQPKHREAFTAAIKTSVAARIDSFAGRRS